MKATSALTVIGKVALIVAVSFSPLEMVTEGLREVPALADAAPPP